MLLINSPLLHPYFNIKVSPAEKTRSTVTSLNPIWSLRAGSREEACDKASSKRNSAHLNAGMKDDLAASLPAAHSCPVSCKGMLNWPFAEKNRTQLAAHCAQTPCCFIPKDANNSVVRLNSRALDVEHSSSAGSPAPRLSRTRTRTQT